MQAAVSCRAPRSGRASTSSWQQQTHRLAPVKAAKLHVPNQDESPGLVFDILYGSAMQAQQVAQCYNNCLATSVSVVKAAELLGVPGYKLVFGHLAPTKEGINGEVPHVWVEYAGRLIMDATLSDVLPPNELFSFKSQLRYVPGRAANPMLNAGLPAEAPDQERLEHFVGHADEYVDLLARAPTNTTQASAYLLYTSITQGLAAAKDDIQGLLKEQEQTQS